MLRVSFTIRSLPIVRINLGAGSLLYFPINYGRKGIIALRLYFVKLTSGGSLEFARDYTRRRLCQFTLPIRCSALVSRSLPILRWRQVSPPIEASSYLMQCIAKGWSGWTMCQPCPWNSGLDWQGKVGGWEC